MSPLAFLDFLECTTSIPPIRKLDIVPLRKCVLLERRAPLRPHSVVYQRSNISIRDSYRSANDPIRDNQLTSRLLLRIVELLPDDSACRNILDTDCIPFCSPNPIGHEPVIRIPDIA